MKLFRLTAAHGSGFGLDHDILQPAAIKNGLISLAVKSVALIQSLRSQIETIGVLHRELPGSQKTRLGSGFIPELRLDLIPDLRQLPIGAKFVAGNGSEYFLMSHAQAQLAVRPIPETKQILTHELPASRFLPKFCGMQSRQVKLLGPDPIHLFPDDRFDFQQSPSGQGKIRINSCAQLSNKPARKRSWWEGASASAGTSRSVGTKS